MVYGQVPNMSPPSRPALRGYAVEAIVLGLVLVFLIVAVVPTWLLGGFRQAPEPLPTIQPGQTVKYGKFKITPISAQWVKADPDDETLAPDEKPRDKIVVLVAITNRSKKIAYNVEEDFQLKPPGRNKPVPADETDSLRDEYGSATPLPDLPEKIKLTWKMPKGTSPPSDIRVTIMRETYERDFIQNELGWYSPHPWLNVTLPVKQAAQ